MKNSTEKEIKIVESNAYDLFRNRYGLTVKQEEFAQQVLVLGNYSGAYRAVYNAEGMTNESIHVAASRLSSHAKVSLRIQELRTQSQIRNDVTVDRIASELSMIAFGDIREVFNDDWSVKPLAEMSDTGRAMIKKYKISHVQVGDDIKVVEEIELKDSLMALEKLAKHIGFYDMDNAQKEQYVSKEEGASRYKAAIDSQREKQKTMQLEGRGERIAKELEEEQKLIR